MAFFSISKTNIIYSLLKYLFGLIFTKDKLFSYDTTLCITPKCLKSSLTIKILTLIMLYLFMGVGKPKVSPHLTLNQ